MSTLQNKTTRTTHPWNYSTACHVDQSMRTVKYAGLYSIFDIFTGLQQISLSSELQDQYFSNRVQAQKIMGFPNITITTDVKILLRRPVPFVHLLEPNAGAVDASAATVAASTHALISVFKLSFNKATQNIPLALHFSSLEFLLEPLRHPAG